MKQKQDLASKTVLGNSMFLGTGFSSEVCTATKIPKKAVTNTRARQEEGKERLENREELNDNKAGVTPQPSRPLLEVDDYRSGGSLQMQGEGQLSKSGCGV